MKYEKSYFIGKDFVSNIDYEVTGDEIDKTFCEISRKDFQGAIS